MIKKAFLVGIKGVGMTSLAVFLKEANIEVSGSDSAEHFITDEVLQMHAIRITENFDTQTIDSFIQRSKNDELLFIVSAAHGGFDNPQIVYAKSLGYRVLSYAQALGECMNGSIIHKGNLKGISITGAHGKTTISAFLASALSFLSYDPSYIVGTSMIYPIGEGGHYGKGDFFVAEADEYLSDITYDRKPKFMYQFPTYAIINNIDFDHPDFFTDFNAVLTAYYDFIQNVKEDGILFVNGDDSAIQKLIEKDNGKRRFIRYGQRSTNDYILKNFEESDGISSFQVETYKGVLGEFSINLAGIHNAMNSLSVIVLLLTIGVPVAKIQEVLPLFKGSKRRLEHLGNTPQGAIVMDDYAHHPDEVQKSLAALRTRYKHKKIVCIFQSHTYSRTQALLSQFVHSFNGVTNLILLPTFPSAREQKVFDDPTNILRDELIKNGLPVNLLPTKASVVEYVTSHFLSPEYLIVTMGAGDVYQVAEELLNRS